MDKRRWFVLPVIFLLAQSIMSSSVLAFESVPLNPPVNIDVNYSDGAFVAFQVLPSVNEILSDCRIKPLTIYPSFEVDRSL